MAYTKQAQPAQTDGEKSRQATHDIVAIDDQGEIIKQLNATTGNQESVRIGSIWLGEKSGFIKFENGETAKVFPRRAAGASAAGAPPAAGGAPAAPAAAAPAPARGASRFSSGPKTK